MVTKEFLKEKIEEHLPKWKTTIDGLKVKFEQAEADSKAKLHDQIELLHDNCVKAEKLLENISATSQDAWEQVKSGIEQGWTELSRTAKHTIAKVREAIAKPKHDEEIRQIAYHLWQEEGCPDGRHLDHWFKAESIWQARQEATQPDQQPRPKAKRARKKTATPAKTKSRAVKPKAVPSKEHPAQGTKEP
jgi:hypothetical protein